MTRNQAILAEIKREQARPVLEDYRPYHNLPGFDEGITDYMRGRHYNPYDGNVREGLKAQAWDRGSEYAMRVVRWSEASQ
jgi:hypothetical protein